jgi:glucokinase
MTKSKESESVFIGIDLGGTTLKGALVSGVGETLQGIRIETERESSDRLFEQIVGAVRTLREDRISGDRVAGVGIGIPGLVNRKTNRIEVMTNLPCSCRS